MRVFGFKGASLLRFAIIGVPVVVLTVFFVLPNMFLLSASFMVSESQRLTGELTLDNYAMVLTRPFYLAVILRSFATAAAVGLAVVVLSFPIAYFITRSTSAWKGLLTAIAMAPLLASVVVKTYGWHVILNRFGLLNDWLLALGAISERISFIPSNGAIVSGLTHALLPYGVLTIMASLQGLNPNLEKAAMSLGATRRTTFRRIVVPLCLPGIIGAFAIAFAMAISAYATPRILGGPQQEMLATQIYVVMVSILDWSLGSTLGMILIVSALTLVYGASLLGSRGRMEKA